MTSMFQVTLSHSAGRRQAEFITGTWKLHDDIFETKDRLVLKAELPGFKEDQIHLRFEDGVLSLEGERKFEKESGDENYHRVERSYGKFVRSFSIPGTVSTEGIKATFDNGILTVSLPKREETKPKRIRIETAPKAPAIEVKAAGSGG